MNEMIDISKLKTYSKPHKVYIPSQHGSFVKRADLEQLLETAHNSDYAKCKEAYIDGYESGHNDTVESCYGWSDEKADEWISEHFA